MAATSGKCRRRPPAGAPRNLTPGMHWSASRLAWRSPSELLFAGHRDGGFGIASIEPATGRLTSLYAGAEKIGHFGRRARRARPSRSASPSRARPRSGPGPIGAWKKLSSANASAKRFWGEAKSLHWESDGANVQGWLLYPEGFDPAASVAYPMVVVVHGGPAGASTSSWPSRWHGDASVAGLLRLPAESRAAASASARPSPRATSRTSAAATCATSSRGVDAVLAQPRRDRPETPRHHGLELRRLHDHVGRDADRPLRGRRRRRRHRELAELLRPEQDRHLDAPLLRRLGVRRPEGLREVLAHRVHQEGRRRRRSSSTASATPRSRRPRATSSGTP